MTFKGVCIGVGISMVIVWLVSSQNTQQVVDRMYEHNLTRYESAEEFRSEEYVTRGEIAKFFSSYAVQLELPYVHTIESCQFNDIDTYDWTLTPYITESCRYGLMKWFEWSFRPESLITRAEALTVAIRSILWVQDESMNPWWSITHEKATNLWLIQEMWVRELDEPAQRIRIGKWLYTIANEIHPRLQSTSWPVQEVVIDDQTWAIIAITGLWEQIQVYQPNSDNYLLPPATEAILSPNGKYIAYQLEEIRMRSMIYDADQEKTYRLPFWVMIKWWDDAWRLQVERCLNGNTCIQPRSLDANQPWIIPEVWIDGWATAFACHLGVDTWSQIDLLLRINGWAIQNLKTVSKCVWIPDWSYLKYDIPSDALLAVMDQDGQYYLIKEDDQYMVYYWVDWVFEQIDNY